MPKPIRLAHAVLKTFDLPKLRQFYCDLLDARVVFEKGTAVSFITYDEEHHRLGFMAMPGEPLANDPRAPGLSHLAFTFANVRDLLVQYEQLKKRGITPTYNVNHGPTLSFYYTDPEGNGVEMMVDRFATAEEAQQFIDENFDRNPIGVECDPDELVAMMHAGATDEELMHFDGTKPIAMPTHVAGQFDEMLA